MNHKSPITCLLLIIGFLQTSEGARILAIYPTPSISHQVVFRPLMLELARNHEVVVITTDAIQDPPANYTQIDLHDISYESWRDSVIKTLDGSADTWAFMEKAFEVMENLIELQLTSNEVQQLLNSNQHFDLVFAEAIAPTSFAFARYFNTPLILFSSLTFNYPATNHIGAASHPLLFPDLSRKRLYNLSVYEKINGLYEEYSFRSLVNRQKRLYDRIVKKLFGPNYPSTDEMSANADMLFLGVNYLWDDNRPVPPGVVYTGALHVQPLKELPIDLKSYLDNSKHGVIYMSFGTNVDPTLLSPERIKIFCKVFSKLPYDVLWKWNGDELPGKPDNVRISKWLPQSDLLRHKKIKLFITQAGLQSTDEAIVGGVPLIAFPMLGDQWYNAEKYEHFGIGRKMDFETVTEESLRIAIDSVIGDKKYKESITRLGALMRDQPQSPLQRAVWWTEHVLRHRGAAHLRSAAANVSWTDYLMLDVVLVLLSALLLTVFLLVLVLYKVLRVLRILPQKSKQKRA